MMMCTGELKTRDLKTHVLNLLFFVNSWFFFYHHMFPTRTSTPKNAHRLSLVRLKEIDLEEKNEVDDTSWVRNMCPIVAQICETVEKVKSTPLERLDFNKTLEQWDENAETLRTLHLFLRVYS